MNLVPNLMPIIPWRAKASGMSAFVDQLSNTGSYTSFFLISPNPLESEPPNTLNQTIKPTATIPQRAVGIGVFSARY